MEILKDIALVFDTLVAVAVVVVWWPRHTTEIWPDTLENFDLYLEALKGDKRVKSQKAPAKQKSAVGQSKKKKTTKKA